MEQNKKNKDEKKIVRSLYTYIYVLIDSYTQIIDE